MINPPPPSTHPPTGRGGLIIAAPASGQGKTTITLGLLRALRRAGVAVRSAKSGPDYIDPAFHEAASGAPCINLDSWAMAPEDLRARAAGAPDELLIIEGAMGLLDAAAGQRPGGAGSVHAVATALALPVVLVIDVSRMGQSIRAIVAGFAAESGAEIAGVILNRVGSARHERMLRAALDGLIPVFGSVARDDGLVLPSRHLGLVQASEHPELEAFLNRAADVVSAGCNISEIAALGAPMATGAALATRFAPLGQRIAVASDSSFSFAYQHLLDDWRWAGAEILPFSPLADEGPVLDADAVYLPGGYPELSAGQLSTAEQFRAGMLKAAASGALVYGECGGYMMLGDGLVDADGNRHAMLGLLRLETTFADRARQLGYRALVTRQGPLRGRFRGHEYHYAKTLRADGTALFEAMDAEGTILPPMGLCEGRVFGSFAHLIAPVG